MKLNLLVIKTNQLENLKNQYKLLGLEFEYHRHGKGAWHYATEIEGVVFEIYPVKSDSHVDNSIRLGFSIPKLSEKIEFLKSSTWKIISEPQQTEWGKIAIIQDLDGRKIELSDTKI